MIEFAFAIPILFLFLVGVAYFGRVLYVKQIVAMAAQEGARVACRIPNLKDSSTREFVRGFTIDGKETNKDSVIYAMLGSGSLLAQGNKGNLPDGSRVQILPWDSNGTSDDYTPPGTIAVRINYPFTFVGNQFRDKNGNAGINIWLGFKGTPLALSNFTIKEQAVVSQEVYQEVN